MKKQLLISTLVLLNWIPGVSAEILAEFDTSDAASSAPAPVSGGTTSAAQGSSTAQKGSDVLPSEEDNEYDGPLGDQDGDPGETED